MKYAGVYPRPCGETVIGHADGSEPAGLSPPMRGNHPRRRTVRTLQGSIPAHAGKPRQDSNLQPLSRVYPRPCGETRQCFRLRHATTGLSPPMRGNHVVGDGARQAVGSIPAHAGKPGAPHRGRLRHRVYPRPCGETAWCLSKLTLAAGLSPPMRGNRRYGRERDAGEGSIPAHAGKPTTLPATVTGRRVYPRPCGETTAVLCVAGSSTGLSPPMRGNHGRQGLLGAGGGSIPAHAGKPSSTVSRAAPSRVYPRPCGETQAEAIALR